MALSTGQINDAYLNALGRMPTGEEARAASARGDLEGSSGQQQLMMELGGGAGGVGGGGDYVSSLIQTLTGQVVPQAIEFDTEAARRAAEEEWGPYYDELLEDYLAEVGIYKTRAEEDLATYLTGLGTQRGREEEDLASVLEAYGITGARSEEDLANILGLLGERREEYLADVARESPLIQEAIGGGYADRGLYFGGEREEAQRRQLEKEEREKAAYEREYGYQTGQARLGAERTQEDIARKSRLAERETGRTQEDIQRQEEARQLQHERYMADVERKRKERERELAREREQAVTGQVEKLREEKYYGWS